MRLRAARRIPDPDAASPAGSRTGADQRLCWSAVVWSPPPESNRRHHPYHESRQERCATQGIRSSANTVNATCMGSVTQPSQLFDHDKLAVLEDLVVQNPQPLANTMVRKSSPAIIGKAAVAEIGAGLAGHDGLGRASSAATSSQATCRTRRLGRAARAGRGSRPAAQETWGQLDRSGTG
jgi:hypothetical protein